MYHAILSDEVFHGYSDKGDIVYVVDKNEFECQLKYLRNNNYKSYLISELPLSDSNDNNVIITFDDGHISNYKVAFPILQKYGFKATFFVTTDWIGRKYYMNNSQIQKLSNSGMEIGSHGHTHQFLDYLKYDDVVNELTKSQKILNSITGKSIISFAAPGGRLNEECENICHKLGIDFICTSKVGCVGIVNVSNIYRVAVVRNMDIKIFIDIVTCNYLFYFRSKFKFFLLKSAKKTLGNELYVKVRSYFI